MTHTPCRPIGRLLMQAARTYREAAMAQLRARGYVQLTMAHAGILPHIDVPGTRLTAIAERAAMTKQSVSQLVSELEKAGYVQRRRDENDGRAQQIAFTPLGMACREDLNTIKCEIEMALMDSIGAQETDTLCNVLARMPALLSAKR